MTNMQFTGKLTEADLNDVRKMTRSKMYWLKLLAANWYGTALTLIVIGATISGLLGLTKPNWQAVALIWAVVAGIVLWAVYGTKRAQALELTQLNATLPDQVNLTAEGVRLDGPNGATGFLPWRNFNGWREGGQVVLVHKSQGNRFVILPVPQLSEIDRQSIREFLQSHISPASK
jgi:hypothetical protein